MCLHHRGVQPFWMRFCVTYCFESIKWRFCEMGRIMKDTRALRFGR